MFEKQHWHARPADAELATLKSLPRRAGRRRNGPTSAGGGLQRTAPPGWQKPLEHLLVAGEQPRRLAAHDHRLLRAFPLGLLPLQLPVPARVHLRPGRLFQPGHLHRHRSPAALPPLLHVLAAPAEPVRLRGPGSACHLPGEMVAKEGQRRSLMQTWSGPGSDRGRIRHQAHGDPRRTMNSRTRRTQWTRTSW